MRITSGRFRGRSLQTPSGQATRPTSDRARQAVFNILEHAPWSQGLKDVRVIDLFAGSGALGLEAVSRGAAFGLFVDTDEAARGAVRDNIEALGLFGSARIHRRDATDLGRRPGGLAEAFDLAFLDPPYGRSLGEQALAGLVSGDWLAAGAVCVLERGPAEPALAAPRFSLLDQRRYGVAEVSFLRFEPERVDEPELSPKLRADAGEGR